MTFFINGEPVKKLDVSMADIEYSSPAEEFAIKDGQDLRFTSKSYSGTLENVQISSEFKDMIIDSSQHFKVVAESFSFPRGNKLPKKKRIRKKWMKKYYKKIELDNVELSPMCSTIY